MAIVTVDGIVVRAVENNKLCTLKETFVSSYTPANGETVTKEATRYWTIWFNKPHSISEGTAIQVTGEYATVSGNPHPETGKIWPQHKLNDASVGRNPADVHAIPVTAATDLLTQLSDVPF